MYHVFFFTADMMSIEQQFLGFCLALVIMQNFFMFITIQYIKQAYRLSSLMLLFMINAIVVYAAYRSGLQLLAIMPYNNVRLIVLAVIALAQVLVWSYKGSKHVVTSLVIAQLLASFFAYSGYDFFLFMTC